MWASAQISSSFRTASSAPTPDSSSSVRRSVMEHSTALSRALDTKSSVLANTRVYSNRQLCSLDQIGRYASRSADPEVLHVKTTARKKRELLRTNEHVVEEG